MASGYVAALLLATVVACFTGAEAGAAWCVTNSVEYCDYGCCGESPNIECCGMDAAAIVGLVIGILIMVAIVVGIILCCVMYAKKRPTRVVQPQPTTVIMTGQQGHGQGATVFQTGGGACYGGPQMYSMQGQQHPMGMGYGQPAPGQPMGFGQPMGPGYGQPAPGQPMGFGQPGASGGFPGADPAFPPPYASGLPGKPGGY